MTPQRLHAELRLIEETMRKALESIGINCGKVHNPSAKVDPGYWRFFVHAQSYNDFIDTIGSWHPRKARLLLSRMKI